VDTYTADCLTPIGRFILASDGERLVGAWLMGQKHFGGKRAGSLVPRDGVPVLALAARWLDRYFAGEKPGAEELPLAPEGTRYQRAVWDVLRDIPYGEVKSYAEVAAAAAKRMGTSSASARAAGGAVGRNPLSVFIPCHRVVGAGGSLTGYAGGLDRKEWLLRHEGAIEPSATCLSRNAPASGQPF